MFYKKRNAQRAQEQGESRLQVEKKFHKAILKARLIEDPAKRVLTLREISDDIQAHINSEYKAINVRAAKSDTRVSLGSSATAGVGSLSVLGAFAASGVVLTGPIGGAVIGGAMAMAIAGLFAGTKRSISMTGKLKEAVSGHIEEMTALQSRADDMTDAAVKFNVREISKSPLYEQVRSLPGIAEKFADAAAKQLAANETPASKAIVQPKIVTLKAV